MKSEVRSTNSWTGMDWHGLAWTGTDWHGLARTGTDWHGLARTGADEHRGRTFFSESRSKAFRGSQ